MTTSVLETRNVRKVYQVSTGIFMPKGLLRAVNGVSFKLKKGQIQGIVGESGCGKTTFARMLLGIEKPTEGEIFIEGKPHSKFDRKEVARKIQPIFQDPYSSLNPRKRVGSIVSMLLRGHKVGTKHQWREKAENIMELVGLPRRLYNNFPNQLSGGQRQRVAIARSLIMKPEVVICDEPTSALDVSVQSQILNLLKHLQNELGLTYIFISHNLAVVQHMATRVSVMYLGRIVEEADTETLFRNPKHPYTRMLLKSILTPEPDLDLPEVNLDTSFPNPVAPPSGCPFHPRCSDKMPICTQSGLKPRMVGSVYVECHLYDESL